MNTIHSTTKKYAFIHIAIGLLMLLWTLPGIVLAAEKQSAKLIDQEGQVEFNRAEQKSTWQPAQINQMLHAGETIRTGPHSRASLLLADESLIKLKESSEFTVGEVAPSAGWTLINAKKEQPPSIQSQFTLKQGGAWFLNKNKAVAIVFKTPTAEIGIRGTELVVQLDPEETLQVAALEGSAQIENDQGKLLISSGEESITRAGTAPVKQLLLHPENAVQWMISVPPLFTPRDLHQQGPGWNELVQGAVTKALTHFSQIKNPQPTDLLGEIAALITLRRFKEAETTLTKAQTSYPNHHPFVLQQAWFDLMTGEIVKANKALITTTAQHPKEAMGWQLRALTALALDHQTEMTQAANQAIALAPESPTSWIIQAYVQQAQFNLDDAEISIQKALTLEPENVVALIALAKLQFGSGHTPDALTTMNKAAKLAPDNAEVNNLHGFILFSMRQVEPAIVAFNKASQQDTTLAEPRMGLGLAFMRQGETARAFEEITTAVLLDPRRSLLRSYWAKMLYQIQRHEKARDVLKMARTLDPRDPTPLLYDAIILRDLNRPTQAIQTINDAIALNDNRAVYRSRFMLDGDLAVKNIDLSKLFNQLDLTAWAKNKAVASVRQDYTNASGHLFYAGALADEEGRSWARNSENLLARLLQPANMNTFNSFNDYTTFVEKPGVDFNLSLTAGNHDTLNQMVIASGAAPQQNLAYQVGYLNNDTDGWRDGHYDHARSVVGYMKWDATQNGSLMLVASNTDTWQGDKISPRFEFDEPIASRDNLESSSHRLEAGYHYHLAPGSDVLLHAAQIRTPIDLNAAARLNQATADTILLGSTIDLSNKVKLINEFYQLQSEYLHKKGAHQLLTGVIHYSGNETYSNARLLEVINPALGNFPLAPGVADQKRIMQSLFIQDIYQLHPKFIIEADLHYDHMETGSSANNTTWSLNQWSPRLGAVWTPHKAHTLRLAGFRSLLPFGGDRLDPADIAGIPVHRNGTPGALTEEAQLVWEYTSLKDFWSASLFHMERDEEEITANGNQLIWGSQMKGVEIIHNRLLGMGFGLALRYQYAHLFDPKAEQSATVNRNEHRAEVGLKWVDTTGWSAKAKESFRTLDFQANRANENIWLTNLETAYEFPKKTGSLQLNIDNLFDEHFNWVTDPFVFQGRNPAREVYVTLNLAF